MKILHVNYSDTGGGASIAALRLHEALNRSNINSEILCLRRTKNLPGVLVAKNKTYQKINGLNNIIINSVLKRFSYPTGSSLNLFPSGIHTIINQSDADIVHLHWINAEMMSISEIARITKPIIWSLHDLWPFLGCEHYPDFNDSRYIDGYRRQKWFDVEWMTWERKRRLWRRLHPTFVSVSQWGADMIKKSFLFKHSNVVVLPNTLDTEVFRPYPKREAREMFGLPRDKNLILFGATKGVMATDRKGFDLLVDALLILKKNKAEFELVIFGNTGSDSFSDLGYPVHDVGKISDESMLSILYSSADVMCVPSRMETFGQTAAEALSCGVPVVAFNATGLKDIVDNRKNGYLAEPYDSADFAAGIEWILRKMEEKTGSDGYGVLCEMARKKAVTHFDYSIVADKFNDFYSSIL